MEDRLGRLQDRACKRRQIAKDVMVELDLNTRQIKAARALLGWSQGDSSISEPTIARLEALDGPIAGRPNTAEKIRGALEKAGIQFINENGGGPGVRLRKPQRFKKTK